MQRVANAFATRTQRNQTTGGAAKLAERAPASEASFIYTVSVFRAMTLRGAIVDLDGTVYVGEDLLDGTPAGIKALRAAGLDLLFFSNNPVRSGDIYVEHLTEKGLDIGEGEACSSGDVTVAHLQDNHPDDRILCIGSSGLADQLRAGGLELIEDVPRENPVDGGPGDEFLEAACDVLVASWTAEFDYDDMYRALTAVDDDTPFFGTDPDRTYQATGDVLVPGSGAIIGALAATLDREADAILGKPSDAARELALDRLGHPPEECLVVGDRLDTDLAMGHHAGMTTVLVLTGVTDREDVEASEPQPDYVIDDLGDIDMVLDDR